jgi:hypothetical protein
VEGFELVLREHGPFWIMADEDPSAHFSIHARVLIGLRSDGTPDGTTATFLDTIPNAPSPSTETVATPRVQKKGQVFYLVSASVCQPADRRVVQVHYICHLSLAISVTMYRLDNPGVPFGLGELPFKQSLQCRSA